MDEVIVRLQEIGGQLRLLITDPTSNLMGALLLYGMIAVLLLVFLVIAIMLLSEDDEEEYLVEGDAATAVAAQQAAARVAEPEPVREPRDPLVTYILVAVIVTAAWLAAGYTTSANAVCSSCHLRTVHAEAVEGTDPHASSDCVSCHEPGGLVGRYATGVGPRVLHFVDGAVEQISVGEDYGRVTSLSCSRCHDEQIEGVTTSADRGIIMSHTEPLEASVRCLDCHQISQGVVAAHNAGMSPCLRCHDAVRASAACVTCHDEKAAAAARSEITTAFAAVQIPEVKCGGCHVEKRECDPCHGTRMPHSKEFMVYAHARSGAVDFWYNGGRTCARCHTAERRPCQKCHTPTLGKGHGPRNATAHIDANSVQCNSCHYQWAYSPQRNFCQDVCHTPVAKKESPR